MCQPNRVAAKACYDTADTLDDMHNPRQNNGLILELMNKAIELDPDNGEYYAFRAIVKMNLGPIDWEAVLEDYETALEKDIDPIHAELIGFYIEDIKEKKLHAVSDAAASETEA